MEPIRKVIPKSRRIFDKRFQYNDVVEITFIKKGNEETREVKA